MNQVLPMKETIDRSWGHTWMEMRPGAEDPPTIPPEEYVFEIVWIGEERLLVDCYGGTSTGRWRDENIDEYGVTWRLWLERPTPEDMKRTPWKRAEKEE